MKMYDELERRVTIRLGEALVKLGKNKIKPTEDEVLELTKQVTKECILEMQKEQINALELMAEELKDVAHEEAINIENLEKLFKR